MMNLKSRVGAVVATVALLGGLGVATAPAASAVPTCTVAVNRTGVSSTCTGSGQFRLFYTCYAAYPWESTWTRYGSWLRAPLSSSLSVGNSCAITNQFQGGVQKR